MRPAVRGVPKGALRTHSAEQAPLWGGLVMRRVLFARAPMLGLCFLVTVNAVAPRWGRRLVFTRYCYHQHCMVYSIQTGGRRGSRILSNNRAIVLHQDGQCRWAGVNQRMVDSRTTASK